MSTPSPTSPQRRPRLSLQIKAIANGPSGRTSRTLAAAVDVKSPTAFNTLSNVYATAVDRSTPVQDKPPATVLSGAKPTLRLQIQDSTITNTPAKGRGSHTPYLGPYLDTPLSAQPQSPAMVAAKDVRFPSSMTMTATPPLSAVEQTGSQSFEGASTTPLTAKPTQTPQTPGGARRRTTMPATLNKPPYTHTRSLRSILRNSPLPPLSTKSPISPRRQSVRLQEKAARRVAYNSPLCQTITTSKYTISHIDLLSEDQTPTTPSQSENDENPLDTTMAYTGNETRDGGQTPGPFEEMRRRMAGLHASTPTTAPTTPVSAGGIRKRGAKKKEKKRRWVWTIGKEEGEDEDGSPVGVVTPPVAATPAPVVLVAMPVPKGGGVPVPKAAGVPVLAVPAPRPRTRMQMQMTAPTAAPKAPVALVPRAATTPEPVTAILAPEPPTPSLSVGSSTADPVFESRADVEMSDASSMFSEDDNHIQKPDAMMGADFGDEMDTDTPVTAQRVVFQEANRGWGQSPWIASSG